MLCKECSGNFDCMSCPPCSHVNCKCDGKKETPKKCEFYANSLSCLLCSTCGEAMKRCEMCTREIIVEDDGINDEVLGEPLPDTELESES